MPDESAKFARAAVELLERENPSAIQLVAAALRRIRIGFEIDSGAFELMVQNSRLRVDSLRPKPDVTVSCSSSTLKSLLAGTDRIGIALLAGRLDATGTVAALAALGAAFSQFLRGAVACPSFPELYERYLGAP